MENQIVQYEQKSLLLDENKFNHACRVAKMLSVSSMVPDQFRGEQNVGNCMIALNLADRLELDPFMLMQKMYIVHGKPGIEAQLAIALINKSGKFSPLQFQLEGEGDNRSCTAHATHLQTKEKCSQTITMKMAKDEKWIEKAGSKWKTMPDLMLQYRSASFFARVYCPESLLGLQTSDELHDIIDVTPVKKEKVKELSPGKTDMYKTDTEKPVEKPELSKMITPETLCLVDECFDIDNQLAKKVLNDIGRDNTNAMTEEQGQKFLVEFKTLLDAA